MARVKFNSTTELAIFSIGFFIMSSHYIQQFLIGMAKNRRALSKKSSKALMSTIKDDNMTVTPKDVKVSTDGSEKQRIKSALYTKTGDKGFSSVRN